MAGWQAGLLVLVQSVLQQLHVVLPANTAANNLQTGPAHNTCCDGHVLRSIALQTYNIYDMQKCVMHGMDRMHDWLVSKVATCFVVMGM